MASFDKTTDLASFRFPGGWINDLAIDPFMLVGRMGSLRTRDRILPTVALHKADGEQGERAKEKPENEPTGSVAALA
jgi:hypothetical protein